MAPPKRPVADGSSERPSNSGTAATLEPLTPREQEVVKWIAKAKRNDEIALFLKLSPRTVEKHVQNILRKLGVESRTGACAWWHEQRRDGEL